MDEDSRSPIVPEGSAIEDPESAERAGPTFADAEGAGPEGPVIEDPAGPGQSAGNGVPRTRKEVRNDQDEAPARRRGPIATFLRETTIVVVAALVLSLVIKTFFAQAFYIPSVSMQDTLQVGDRLVVNKLVPGISDIERGDVVVFLDPGGWLGGAEQAPEQNAVQKVLTFIGILPENADEHLIKRVIGVGGDNVICCDDSGRISVNGVSIDEPYLPPGVEPSTEEFDVVVPDEHLWLLGDYRARSADSRYHGGAAGGGFVPVRNVVGRAFVIIWPLDRLTWLSTSDEVFEAVPEHS